MSDTAGVRWYRIGAQRLFWAVFVSTLSVPSVVLIVFGLGSPASPAKVVAGAVMLAAVAGWVRLVLRAGIGVAPGHVLLRDAVGRTRVIPWPQVARFEATVGSREHVTIYVRTSGGKRWQTMGCSFSGSGHQEARDLLRTLENERPSWPPGPARTPASRPSRPQEPAWAWIVLEFVVLIIAFCVFVGGPLYAGVTQLGPELRASHGTGTAGYYIPRHKSCARRSGCHWDGEFRLPGGRVTHRDVQLADVATASLRADVPVPARDAGDGGVVYPRSDPQAWHNAAVWFVISGWACAVFLGLLIRLGIRRLRPCRPG